MLCALDRIPDLHSEPTMFLITLPASETAVAGALGRVEAELRALGIDPGLCGDVGITLGEVINNVIEHACRGLRDAEITVAGGVTQTDLWIDVIDPGHPFEDGLLPAGDAVDLDRPVEDLPEGGFGWFLIRSLTSGVEYQRHSGRNHLTLWFAL